MEETPSSGRQDPLLFQVAQWRQRVDAAGGADGFTMTHVSLMFVIAQIQGGNVATWIAQDRLARMAGIAKAETAGHALADLVAAGVIRERECCRDCPLRFMGKDGTMDRCPVSRGRAVKHYSIVTGALDGARVVARASTAARANRVARPDGDPRVPGDTRVPDACTPGTGEVTPGYRVACTPGTGDKKTTEKTIQKTTEETNMGAVRPVGGDGQVGLFGDEPKKTAKVAGKPRKAGDSAKRYADAFVAGMAEAGKTITAPTTSDAAMLGRVLAAHAKDEAGAPIHGEAATTWIRTAARDYAMACPDPTRRRGGYSAFGLKQWIDDQRPQQAAPLGGPPMQRGAVPGAMRRISHSAARVQPGGWAGGAAEEWGDMDKSVSAAS